MRSFVMSHQIMMMTTRASVLPGHRQTEHQRQHDSQESHRPNYTALSPCC